MSARHPLLPLLRWLVVSTSKKMGALRRIHPHRLSERRSVGRKSNAVLTPDRSDPHAEEYWQKSGGHCQAGALCLEAWTTVRWEIAVAEVELVATTGSVPMDTLVADTLTRILTALPDRLHAVYALGSYADDSAVATSDLDLVFIITGQFRDGEQALIESLLAECAAQAEGELDGEAVDEASLEAGVTPTLKLGSRLLWGDDLRQRLPLMSLPAWTRDRMHSSYWRLAGLFGRPLPLT